MSSVKTDSVSGEIHLLFPVLGFLEAGLNFEKSLLKSAFRHFQRLRNSLYTFSNFLFLSLN